MRSLLLFSACLALAAARPDIGIKLREQALLQEQQALGHSSEHSGHEATSYDVPSSSIGIDYNPIAHANPVADAEEPSYNAGLRGGVGSSASANSYSASGAAADSGAFAHSHAHAQAAALPKPPPIITKHFYYHTAPEEEAVAQVRAVAPKADQKHYKIIFIKVPTISAQAQAQAAAAAKVEEKTIVYVLVDKPAEAEAGSEAEAESFVPPSKPEVYFIKYQGKAHEAALAQASAGASASADVGVSTGGIDSSSSGAISGSFANADASSSSGVQGDYVLDARIDEDTAAVVQGTEDKHDYHHEQHSEHEHDQEHAYGHYHQQ